MKRSGSVCAWLDFAMRRYRAHYWRTGRRTAGCAAVRESAAARLRRRDPAASAGTADSGYRTPISSLSAVLTVISMAVLQVPAHAGQVGHDVDPERSQLLRRTDTRELEQLRRVIDASGQDHFPLGIDLLVGGFTQSDCRACRLDRDPGLACNSTPIARSRRVRTFRRQRAR